MSAKLYSVGRLSVRPLLSRVSVSSDSQQSRNCYSKRALFLEVRKSASRKTVENLGINVMMELLMVKRTKFMRSVKEQDRYKRNFNRIFFA